MRIKAFAVKDEASFVAAPESSVWLLTLYVRYPFSDELHMVTFPAHRAIRGDWLDISNTIRTWCEPGGKGELIDWCLAEYAPIPF